MFCQFAEESSSEEELEVNPYQELLSSVSQVASLAVSEDDEDGAWQLASNVRHVILNVRMCLWVLNMHVHVHFSLNVCASDSESCVHVSFIYLFTSYCM